MELLDISSCVKICTFSKVAAGYGCRAGCRGRLLLQSADD